MKTKTSAQKSNHKQKAIKSPEPRKSSKIDISKFGYDNKTLDKTRKSFDPLQVIDTKKLSPTKSAMNLSPAKSALDF